MAQRPPASRQWLLGALFISASATAARYMHIGPAALATNDSFSIIAKADEYHFPTNGILLRRNYTGVFAVDKALSFLVAAFLPGAAGWDRNFQLLQTYFLVNFFAVIAVWSIEANRTKNKGRVISYTTIWAIFYQTIGGALVVPLWYLSYVISTSTSTYWAQPPTVPSMNAKALLPALILGYLLPTGFMFYPNLNIHTRQDAVALWQVAPMLVNLIWWIVTMLLPSQRETKSEFQQQQESLPWLKTIYLLVTIVCASTHWFVLYRTINSSDLQLQTVFVPRLQEEFTTTSALLFIFQVDFWIIFGCAMASCFLAAWDMRQIYAGSVNLNRAAIAIALCTVLLGPGAALVFIWYYREIVMNPAGEPEWELRKAN